MNEVNRTVQLRAVGTLSWYPQLVPSVGTLSWYPQLVPSVGTLSWYPQLAPSSAHTSSGHHFHELVKVDGAGAVCVYLVDHTVELLLRQLVVQLLEDLPEHVG